MAKKKPQEHEMAHQEMMQPKEESIQMAVVEKKPEVKEGMVKAISAVNMALKVPNMPGVFQFEMDKEIELPKEVYEAQLKRNKKIFK